MKRTVDELLTEASFHQCAGRTQNMEDKVMMTRILNDESGILTFEWILLLTMLVIGIVGGLAVIRDAYIIEATETAGAVLALNQGYEIQPSIGAEFTVNDKTFASSTMNGSSYADAAGATIVTVAD